MEEFQTEGTICIHKIWCVCCQIISYPDQDPSSQWMQFMKVLKQLNKTYPNSWQEK